MPKLDKQQFIDWLASQPSDRRFKRGSPLSCPLARFLQEDKGYPNAGVALTRWRKNTQSWFGLGWPLPSWAAAFVFNFDFTTHAEDARSALTIARKIT